MTAFPSSARQFNAAPSSLPPERNLLRDFFFPPIRSSFLDKFYPAFLFLFSIFPPRLCFHSPRHLSKCTARLEQRQIRFSVRENVWVKSRVHARM